MEETLQLHPGKLRGTIQIPPSKSDGQRALLCAGLAKGDSLISNLGKSDDEQAMLQVIQDLGRTISPTENGLLISGELSPKPDLEIHAGESGLTSRLMAGTLAALPFRSNLTGRDTLLKRPMTFWLTELKQFGVEFHSENGCLPMQIQGPFQTTSGIVSGKQSSQNISGLLFGMLLNGKGFNLQVNDLVSGPYLQMTLKTLRDFGATIHVEGDIYSADEKQQLTGTNYRVESDWSSASFWLVAAALGHELKITGLSRASLQADREILTVLELAGCEIQGHSDELEIRTSALKAFEFDATDCPDLFPIVAILATQCEGITRITGVNRLQEKESNRALAIQQELKKMGAQIILNGNVMEIPGKVELIGAILDAHHDHRMAMSLGIASTLAAGNSDLTGFESVSKSYPEFWTCFQVLKH